MFRFSIRDLLWLTLVIAVAVCLIRNYNTLEKERAAWLADKDALNKQHDADLANERRIANLRAMEVSGRMVSRAPAGVPSVDRRPAADPNGAPMRYPRFAQPLTPTWPPR